MYFKIIYLTPIFILFSNNSYAKNNSIHPEPNPINYVKNCDIYGKGYFSPAGTETCLAITGYVRTTTQVGQDPYDKTNYQSPANSIRFTLSPTTAFETELGTLKTESSLRFQWGDGADSKGTGTLRKAIIQLGGLQLGLDASNFVSFSNYLGNIINDDDTSLIQCLIVTFAYPI